MLKIVGYADRYSVAPGERIAFKISLEEGAHFDARLVRVVHGDCNPDGPGLKFRHVKSDADLVIRDLSRLPALLKAAPLASIRPELARTGGA